MDHWFRTHLLDEILPRWLEAAVAPNGAFLPRLDRWWRPKPDQVVTLVSQGRLLYCFAQGWRLTGSQAYIEAVGSGALFLLQNLCDWDLGGCYWSCDAKGKVLDTRKDSYGHAFALFGLAHACRATRDTALLEVVHRTWAAFASHLQDARGGVVVGMDRDFTNPRPGRSANPLMHLLEALLAASALDAQYLAEARRVAELAASLVREDGLLPEFYNDDWAALAGPEGGVIDLGHQLEWAFLLSSGVSLGLPDPLLTTGQGLLRAGLNLGLDAATGGLRSVATPEGELPRRDWIWWTQAEALRTLLHYRWERGQAELEPAADRLLELIKSRFVDPEAGGWYASLGEDLRPRGQDKGSEWKVDYHVVGLCCEALRLAPRSLYG
ncbi:MAG TPA: AGE family epimerase/isomerase [Armatimonadota bacterium]|jgi:mannose-6-phosphate isomerase